MTATNHALTGAAIVVLVRDPVLSVALALLSHFVLDALPHFGIHEDDVLKRNKSKLFRRVVATDVIIFTLLLVSLPFAIHSVPWWLLELGMIAALVPDIVWVYRFARETKANVVIDKNWLTHFHQFIQRIEKPWGLAIELCWAVAAGVIIAMTA